MPSPIQQSIDGLREQGPPDTEILNIIRNNSQSDVFTNYANYQERSYFEISINNIS